MKVQRKLSKETKKQISSDYQYSSSYVASQRWKSAVIALIVSFGIFFGGIKSSKAGWFGEEAAAIIASDGALQTAMQTFFQKMTDAAYAMLMKFLEQLILQKLQAVLTDLLGEKFGNLVFRTLTNNSINSNAMYKVQQSALAGVTDPRAKMAVEARLELLMGKPDQVGKPTAACKESGESCGTGPVEYKAFRDGRDIAYRVMQEQKTYWKTQEGKHKDCPGCQASTSQVVDLSKVAAASTSGSAAKTALEGMKLLNPDAVIAADDILFDSVFEAAKVDPKTYNNDDRDSQKKFALFLTPQPVMPANAEPAYDQDALDIERASVLVSVMMGQSPMPLLPDDMINKPNTKTLQLKMWSKFTRFQLARQTLLWTFMPSTHKNMKEEYANFVLSPHDKEVGHTENDKLVYIMKLTQGTNMSLMRLREIQMNHSRLLAVILTAIMEQQNDDGLVASTSTR